MTNSTTSPRQRTHVRELFGLAKNTSIAVVVLPGGRLAPRKIGRGYHWTTPGGKPVYYPNAYRRAFGKPVYHCSTLRIVVGELWIAENIK